MAKPVQEKVYLDPNGIKNKILQFLDANAQLEKNGLTKNALSFVGLPGIAKTSAVLQVCADNNVGCQKVNMANIDDLGEITGYPMKEYLLRKEDSKEEVWANEKNYDSLIEEGFQDTQVSRTGYAEPKWVNNLRGYERSILLLDDSLRAQPRFVNAIMDLN